MTEFPDTRVIRSRAVRRDADRADWMPVYVLLVLAAFAIRSSQFGNPLLHVDEEFYLLVGDRMLHGALPYVDIWDRKPIGLFLLYAGIRLLGGNGIVQYQLVATVFATATACVLARLAGQIASRMAAALAGILYLLLLGFAGGMGGQSPVFYTLFVAGAAVATAGAWADRIEAPRLWWRGVIAMALIGLALQVKYSAVFEGMFLGLVLLHRAQRVTDRPRLIAMATGWIALALMPTMLALGYYVAIGEGPAFVYANFLSILERHDDPTSAILRRLGVVTLTLALPLTAVVVAASGTVWRARSRYAFVLAWLAAALLGFGVFRGWFNHYMLPLFAPIAAACAPLFDRRDRLGLAVAATLMTVGGGGYAVAVRQSLTRAGPVALEEMLAAVRPRLTGCLFVLDGEPMLYHLTGSCLPTRYPFPGHLVLAREAGAIGIDPVAELRRIMATHPSVVVDSRKRDETLENPSANELVRGVLEQDYRLVATVPDRKSVTMIFARRPAS